ncbi:MAG: hypothetical protein R3C56_21320 [Pirellulaceae bacterium]
MVCWQTVLRNGSAYGAFGRILNADGTFATAEFALNQTTASNQSSPQVTSLSTGGFAVTWIGSGDGQSAAIWGRTFDSTGTATSEEFRVSDTASGWNSGPSLTERADGSLIFTWTAYDQNEGSVVRQRIYTQGLIDSTQVGAVIGKRQPCRCRRYAYLFDHRHDSSDFEIVAGHLVVKAGAAFNAATDAPVCHNSLDRQRRELL